MTRKLAPQGRAYALEMPQELRDAVTRLHVVAGIIWCHEVDEGLLYPLEAVCKKVEIPGVNYPTGDEL